MVQMMGEQEAMHTIRVKLSMSNKQQFFFIFGYHVVMMKLYFC